MLRRLHSHFRDHHAYHHSGIYAALLAILINYGIGSWPIDMDMIDAMVEVPILIELHNLAFRTGWITVLALGLLGLARHERVDRVAGAMTLWWAEGPSGWALGYPDGILAEVYRGLFHLVVEIPLDTALRLSRELQALAILYVACYLAALWIATRLIARHGHAHVRAWLVRRYPRIVKEAPLA